MTNFKTFNIKYFGATNSKGSRVKITDNLRNESTFTDYNYSYSNVLDIAIAYLEKKGLELAGYSENKEGYIIITSDFNFKLK